MSNVVSGELNYFVPPTDGEKPHTNINADAKTGIRGKNWGLAQHQLDIENIRGKENEYSLDKTGFQFYSHKSALQGDFGEEDKIKEVYYPESVELLKELTGASRVVLFDHTIRRHRPGTIDDTPEKRQPVAQVHVDQTTNSSIARVHRHLPAGDVPSLLSKRFQIINLWRPISHAALDKPLALCDYRSVNVEKDLVPTDLVYPTHKGEVMSVAFNPEHRWIYKKGMTPDEIVLIKCFDSVQDGRYAVLTPHTSFDDPTTPEDVPLRESIELRALVFYS